jgi:hypothetical protein
VAVDVHEQAKAETALLADRDLKRAFYRARKSRIEYFALGDDEQVGFATYFLNVILDEWNRRHQ